MRNSITLDLDRQNHFRQRYAATHAGWRESGQAYEATARQHVHPGTRVLDIGCGRGGLTELLQGEVALAVGVDPDQRSLVEHRAPGVCRVTGVAEQLPFPNEEFDLVICSWVLEHLVQPWRTFKEIARVLQGPAPCAGRPGGHFIFLAPNAWHPLTWMNWGLGRCGDWQSRLVKRLYGRAGEDAFPVIYRANTLRRIKQLATAAGLMPISLCTIGDPTYLAFNEPLYRLAVLAESLTPGWMKVHLVGDFVKE